MGKMKDLDIRLKCIENNITDMQIIYTRHEVTMRKIISALEKHTTLLELHSTSIKNFGEKRDEICNTTE